MRILTFSSLYPSSAQPRHGIFVEQRLRNLLASGEVQAKVLAPVPWFPLNHKHFERYAAFSEVPRQESRHGIEVLHPRYPVVPKIGMTIAPWLMARAMLPVARRIIASGFDFDIIDAHYFYPDGVAAILLGRALRKPVVITARGSDINVIPNYWLPRRSILWAARQSAAIVTVSLALKDRLLALGVRSGQITVLRNGVDLALFQPVDKSVARTRLDMDERATLLSVGNLVIGKGHHIVIEALSKLPGMQLIVIGQGVMERELKVLAASLGLAERIRFVGTVAQEELKFYYSAADALVLASASEGMPNVLLEAMACGLPVIASRVGGIPEIVTQAAAGILLDDCTSDAVISAVQKLLARNRDGMGDEMATRQHAAQFSWEATTRGQLDLFRDVLARHASSLASPQTAQVQQPSSHRGAPTMNEHLQTMRGDTESGGKPPHSIRDDRPDAPVKSAAAISAALLRTIGGLLSPANGARSKLLTLMYHRVLNAPDPMLEGDMERATFDWQMETLQQHFNVLPLTEAAARLAAGTLPARAACVTFDDGYADNFDVALPILKKWGVPATFFITTGFIDGGRMWNDTVIEAVRRAPGEQLDLADSGLGRYPITNIAERRTAMDALLNQLKYLPMQERGERVNSLAMSVGEPLPDDLMMSSAQILGLHNAGMEIGAHTVNHPILARLTPAEAEAEIANARRALSEIVGQEISSFAYPNGRPGVDYERGHVEAVRRAGFKVSVSTAWGCARQNQDLLQLPRVGSWDATPLRFNLRMLSAYRTAPALTV